MMAANGNDSWKFVKLEDICAQITDGKHGDCQDEPNSGFYFLSCKDVSNGKLNYEGARQITKVDFLDTHRRTKFEPSDVLITNSGTIGRMALAPNNELIHRTTFQKSVAILKPIVSHVAPNFLYYSIQSDIHRLIEFAGGTAQKNLLLRDLRAFEVRVPPLPVQRRIAGILSAYDELIENNQQRIRILEDMARSLYREWFVHFRYPGHESVPLVDSPLGQIPQGWEVTTFGELYDTSSGGTPSRKRPDYFEGGTISWVKSQELLDGFILATDEYITDLGLKESSAKLFPVNTVLVALYGATIGMLGILTCAATTNQACCAVLPKRDPFGREFAFLTLLENRERIIGLRLGAAQQNISQVLLRGFECIKPTDQLVQTFSEKTAPLFERILNLQRQTANLRRTRDLLLPRLLSGQVQLEDVTLP